MSTVEQLQTNQIKVTFTVTPERFREGLQYSFNKNKNLVTIPGFRKGKAPRKIIERSYGKDFFYNDALDFILPQAYEDVCEEHGLQPVYRPSINLGEVSEENGATFIAEIYVRPEVSIDGYYGLTYTEHDNNPTDSDIQERLQQEREKNARQVSVDRPAELGDIVTIDFDGYTDGEPFEGGEGRDYNLTLGTHTFIDNFEEQLVGHVVGDEVSVNVRFPDDYSHESLAGKDATFEVEILDIQAKEFPEIDDDFAQDVSEYETLAEYREYLAEDIKKHKEAHAEEHKRSEIVKKLGDLIVAEVPDVMYEGRLEDMMEEFERSLRYQGMNFDTYRNFTGATEESLRKEWRETAVTDVRAALALDAVAKKENMTVTEDEFKDHVKENMRPGQNADEFIEKISNSRRREIEGSILNKKALDFVLEKSVAVPHE